MTAQKFLTATKKWSRKNLLLITTMIGVMIGISLGFILRHYDIKGRTLTFVSLPGELFMRALYMIIVPLILTSVICGISGVKSMNIGRAGIQIMVFYLGTTAYASILGIILGMVIKPGSNLSPEEEVKINETNYNVNDESHIEISDIVLDLIRNIVPDNIVRSMFQTETTKYRWKHTTANLTDKDGSNFTEQAVPEKYQAYTNTVNFIGIIVFAILFGAALKQIGKKGETLFVCLNELNEVIMQIVVYVMWYSPVGIIFLIAGNIAMAENLDRIFGSLFIQSGTVILGLVIHLLLLNGIYFTLTRKNPLKLMAGMKDAMMITLATASSCAALPTTLRCLHKKCGVRSEICQLVLPIGATINMDAGAMHNSLVCVYIAQLHNITLSFGTLMKIAFYAAFNSIGAAAIPNSFFTALLISLSAVNLPVGDIGMLFVMEWFLDRFKTSMNVYGDCVGASIINHWHGEKLKQENIVREIKHLKETEKFEEKEKSECNTYAVQES